MVVPLAGWFLSVLNKITSLLWAPSYCEHIFCGPQVSTLARFNKGWSIFVYGFLNSFMERNFLTPPTNPKSFHHTIIWICPSVRLSVRPSVCSTSPRPFVDRSRPSLAGMLEMGHSFPWQPNGIWKCRLLGPNWLWRVKILQPNFLKI